MIGPYEFPPKLGWTNGSGWEPARPLQRSLGPSGLEMPKKSRKCLPGPPAPGPQKVSKKSRGQSGKSPESLGKVSGECFWSIPDFLETFWGPGAGGPGRHFRDLFGISGPEGPRDLCKGRAGSQGSGTNMTGRPGYWTMEMVGGSSVSCTSLVPLASPYFLLCLTGVETEGLLDYQGKAGIISIVRWNLLPVIFGVEWRSKFSESSSLDRYWSIECSSSGCLFNSTVRELPGKSPGNFQGSPGAFPEARGSLTPSQRLAKCVSKDTNRHNFIRCAILSLAFVN